MNLPPGFWIDCADGPNGVVARVFSEQSGDDWLWESKALPYSEADAELARETAVAAAVMWARDYAGVEPLGEAQPPDPIAGEFFVAAPEASARRRRLVAPLRPERSDRPARYSSIASVRASLELLRVRVDHLERSLLIIEAERKLSDDRHEHLGHAHRRNVARCPHCNGAGSFPHFGDDRICGHCAGTGDAPSHP